MAQPTAYDYDAQEWKTGPEAVALLRAQYRQTLDLLRSTEGANYAAFAGGNRTEMIRATRAALTDLDRRYGLDRPPDGCARCGGRSGHHDGNCDAAYL